MNWFAVFFTFLCLADWTNQQSSIIQSEKKKKTVRQQKKYVIIPMDYLRTEPPVPEEPDEKLIINVAIMIWAITEVSAQEMHMEIDSYVTLVWQDFRISFNRTLVTGNNTWIPIGRNSSKDLWRPQVSFLNCIGCDILNLNPDKNKMFFSHDNDTLKVMTRTLNKFTCAINLQKYPMDEQICKIQLVNYYEDTSEVELNHVFEEHHEDTGSNDTLPEYEITAITPGDCTTTRDGTTISCIEVQVHLQRLIGHHLMVIYAPSIFIVVLSWISFWLHVDAVPARVTLGVTSLLTLSTQFSQAQKSLPPVSYIKAVDVWMIACIFLVFASLLEFAVSNFYWRNEKLNQASKALTTVIQVRPFQVRKEKIFPAEGASNDKSKNEVTKVDKAARIIFPVIFLIFNIIYWTAYS